MIRTIFSTATSLNGYTADEANSLDWLLDNPGNGASSTGRTPPASASVPRRTPTAQALVKA